MGREGEYGGRCRGIIIWVDLGSLMTGGSEGTNSLGSFCFTFLHLNFLLFPLNQNLVLCNFPTDSVVISVSIANLKHNSYSYYPHKEVVSCDSLEYVEFIWLSGIKFIKDLQFWKNIFFVII